MAKAVGFTRDAAERVAKVVRRVEGEPAGGGAGWYPYRGDDGEPVRLGKTTAAWTKGTLATITLYEKGTPPNETAETPATTLKDCVNKFANVAADKWVMVAMGVNGRWYLITAEC